eukprot:EG_transcript_4302
MAHAYYGGYAAYPMLPPFAWDPFCPFPPMVPPPFMDYPWHPGYPPCAVPRCEEQEEDADWTHVVTPSAATDSTSAEPIEGEGDSADPPPASSNLYVMNLPPSFTPLRLRVLFEPFGPLFSIVLFKSRRAACVQFHGKEDAARAMEALDGHQVTPQRTITVKYANRTYRPHLKPELFLSPNCSDAGSVGPLGQSCSDFGSLLPPVENLSMCSLDLAREATLPLEDAVEDDETDGGDWSPPSPDAIEEANFLLETAMIGTALNEKLQEAFTRPWSMGEEGDLSLEAWTEGPLGA